MKRINILFSIVLAVLLSSCETNDPLKDLSTPGKQAPNVYFLPIDPIADANSEIPCEIEYWTAGDEIKSQSLWDKIYLTEDFEIKLKDVDYTYKNSFDTLFRDKQMYKEYDFDFTDWTPDKNAYVFKTKYLVDGAFAKKTYKQNNTGKEAFVKLFSNQTIKLFYTTLIINKTVLKNIVVDNFAVVTLEKFNSWYDKNGLTNDGLDTAFGELSKIGLNNLIGDKYKKIETYKVYLSFKITNGFDEENESSSRSFKVK